MKTDRELLEQVVGYLPECSLTAQEIRVRLAEPEHRGEEQLSELVQELDEKLSQYEQRKPLTYEQIDDIFDKTPEGFFAWRKFARAIEAAHGIKGD